MSDLPVLYSFRRCPFAMRARWALWVAGIAVEHREIVLRDKPAAMLAASPKGTVPVLVLPAGLGAAGGSGANLAGPQVIDESLDVMRWALAQHDPEAWLSPARGSLAEMLALVEACQTQFKPHLDRSKYPQRYVAEVLAGAGRADVDANANADADADAQKATADGLVAGKADATGATGATQVGQVHSEALASFVAEHRQHARAFLLALQARLLQSSGGLAGSGAGAAVEQATATQGACGKTSHAANADVNANANANANVNANAGTAPAALALFGTRPALADFAIAPFVRQFAQADAAHWQAGDWPLVRAWLAALLARSEFEAEVMRKHALWLEPLADASEQGQGRASLG